MKQKEETHHERAQPSAAPSVPPTATPAAPASEPAATGADLQLHTTQAAPKARKQPVYKKWWFWTITGVVVAGAVGVGLGVGLTASQPPSSYFGNGRIF
jgi:hypothetical protein